MGTKIQDKDLYKLLNIEITATTAEIKKAYRKKALECHPDKNPDNPNAAALFHELSLALEILIDTVARKAYDKVLQAKLAAQIRHQELDKYRKKLKEDLEAREKLANLRTDTKSDAEKLQIEIERLRKEGSKAVLEEQEFLKNQIKSEQNSNASKVETKWDSTKYRIKLKWEANKNDPNNGGYNYELLNRFFSKYGEIIGIVVSKKKSGRGLLEFKEREAAIMAIDLEKGLPSNPLKLEWLNEAPPPPESMAKSNLMASGLVKESDFESLVLRKMRQAEERKKLIEQMLLEDE